MSANMSLSIRSFPTESTKYQILVRQAFACAKIPNYVCPILDKLFDEAGYDIDHILPLADGGSNDISNLQALCPSCHRVKTARENRERDRLLRKGGGSPATSSGASSVVSEPRVSEPTAQLITEFSRVKHRVADYISMHYTKTDGSCRMLIDNFLTKYKTWEAKNIKRRKTLPCDPELVKKAAMAMCPATEKSLALGPKALGPK